MLHHDPRIRSPRAGFAALAGLLALIAPTPPSAAEPIVIGETAVVRSNILEEDRQILVYLPEGYARSEDRYPVLVLLDGEGRFHHATGTVAGLVQAGHIPPLIVVGVGNTDRTRDLTPTRWDRTPDDGIEQNPTSGGADRFLRFLTEELRPWVNERYRTVPYDILVGHSLGGLFALHALTAAPDSFDAYVAMSPSADWGDELILRQARELFARGLPGPKHVYLTLADEVAVRPAFANLLELFEHRAPVGLTWRARYLDGDDHGSVPLYSVQLGLESIFAPWAPPTFILDEGIAGLEAHAARLTGLYGFPVRVPENLVNLLGYRRLGEGRVDEAVALFRHNVESYPGSANVYDSLGEGLEAAGRLEEAEAAFRRAVERGERTEVVGYLSDSGGGWRGGVSRPRPGGAGP